MQRVKRGDGVPWGWEAVEGVEDAAEVDQRREREGGDDVGVFEAAGEEADRQGPPTGAANIGIASARRLAR